MADENNPEQVGRSASPASRLASILDEGDVIAADEFGSSETVRRELSALGLNSQQVTAVALAKIEEFEIQSLLHAVHQRKRTVLKPSGGSKSENDMLITAALEYLTDGSDDLASTGKKLRFGA